MRSIASRSCVPDPADPVERLSGGNQQKVVLAKLLATQPKVLMMFDSTRGVDVGTKAEIYTLLRELAAGGSADSVVLDGQ